jgi:hypothetical protein
MRSKEPRLHRGGASACGLLHRRWWGGWGAGWQAAPDRSDERGSGQGYSAASFLLICSNDGYATPFGNAPDSSLYARSTIIPSATARSRE